TPVLDTSSPNKFFESLAAGVPVIQNTQGWMKSFLNEYKVGITLDPNNPKQLAEELIRLKDNVEETIQMGKRAQKIAKERFDKNYLSNKMLDALLSIYKTK